jgi:AraC-like DNA-binding protein
MGQARDDEAAARDHWNVIFTTDAYPEHDRVRAFNEIFGAFGGVRYVQQGTGPLRVTASIQTVGDLAALKLTTTEVEFDNSPGLAQGGEPCLFVNCPLDQTMRLRQRDRELLISAGDIGVARGDEAARGWVDGGSGIALRIPVAALASLLSRGFDIPPALFLRDAPVTKLINGYLGSLLEGGPIADKALGDLITRHVSDLIALGLGPSADGREEIAQRGVRAARLRAIQDHVRANFASQTLSVQTAAFQHGVTPRYVQMLFEAEGTTFSEFVLARRLEHALQMLTSPSHAHLKITDIALASGFLDISYFNRVFRRRFSATPSEVRNSGAGAEEET